MDFIPPFSFFGSFPPPDSFSGRLFMSSLCKNCRISSDSAQPPATDDTDWERAFRDQLKWPQLKRGFGGHSWNAASETS
jgi:hypothetical protein